LGGYERRILGLYMSMICGIGLLLKAATNASLFFPDGAGAWVVNVVLLTDLAARTSRQK
jgi:hypothetical protein